jgi:hypothetical protein
MTSIWGPLGWMTLHSTACAYSENPTTAEKELMSSWLDLFRDSITCPSCKQHFTTVLNNYRIHFPGMLNSRQDLAIFTFRAHNAVNQRIHKPLYSSVEECLATLRNIVKTRHAREYRNTYLAHITRHWKIMQDVSGIVTLKKIQEMKRIEAEYVSQRDTNFEVQLRQDIVVLPRDALEHMNEVQVQRPIFLGNTTNATAGFRLTANGFRLRR